MILVGMSRERPLDRKPDNTNMAAIKNEEQLQQAIEQIQTLSRAIETGAFGSGGNWNSSGFFRLNIFFFEERPP
jgi:hypothetical protein